MKSQPLASLSSQSSWILCRICVLVLCVGPARALEFDFVENGAWQAADSNQMRQAFQDAGQRWAGEFVDNVTVRLLIEYRDLGEGVLGRTKPVTGGTWNYAYSDFRSAYMADRTSDADRSASQHLPTGTSFSLRLNPPPPSFFDPSVALIDTPGVVEYTGQFGDDETDFNNTTVSLWAAQARALGLSAPAGSNYTYDAKITMNSYYSGQWDFNREDGIGTPGSGGERLFDVVGILMHEIGHSLGFDSGAQFTSVYDSAVVTPLDFFRYSSESLASGVMDLSFDGRDESYFSIDGGATPIMEFGHGAHWDVIHSEHLMQYGLATREFQDFSELDRTAFDLIGWDRADVVPEPSTIALLLMSFAGVAFYRSCTSGKR